MKAQPLRRNRRTPYEKLGSLWVNKKALLNGKITKMVESRPTK